MSVARAFVDWVWTGGSVAAHSARAVLAPIAWAFERIVARRNRSFDASITRAPALPAISIGNLTVGGTGKTPVAAWCIGQLKSRGARPAIVMRGVGDDEWRVHSLINPETPVVVSPDRTNGLVIARTRGANCAVLDDAFQHRQVRRVADIVLVSADQWTGRALLLPAGPFREPMSSLGRASLVIVTVKAASDGHVEAALAAVRRAAPDVPCAVMRLQPGALRLAAALPRDGFSPRERGGPRANTFDHPPTWLKGRTVVLVSAIANPVAFETQILGLGAQVTSISQFPDHYRFTAADAKTLAERATGAAGVICTLKDAVKLAPLWPREATPLWYLSQSVVVDRGAEAIDRVLTRLLTARVAAAPTAG